MPNVLCVCAYAMNVGETRPKLVGMMMKLRLWKGGTDNKPDEGMLF